MLTAPAPTGLLGRARNAVAADAGRGLLLMAAAAAGLALANSAAAPLYFGLLAARAGPLTILHWINDLLMSLFFLLVGLEIKRELLVGRLSRPAERRLPVAAAAAGMLVPAGLYLRVAGSGEGLARGWAIPAATDIAFALGILALLGRRAPPSLKLFLTSVAILDDLAAVAVIAAVYTEALNFVALALAALTFGAMLAMNRRGVTRLSPYLAAGGLLWLAMHEAGIHATIAGALTAAAIPMRGARSSAASPLERLEHGLDPWVAFAVVPLFGFANAGIAFPASGLAALAAPVPAAIAVGLFLGKQAGVFGAVRLSLATGFARPPSGASAVQLYGASLLCGIGFTMSLFISALAFEAPALVEQAKLGILCGSAASALGGFAVLWLAHRRCDAAVASAAHPPISRANEQGLER